jgi:hypothetical protein
VKVGRKESSSSTGTVNEASAAKPSGKCLQSPKFAIQALTVVAGGDVVSSGARFSEPEAIMVKCIILLNRPS